MSQRDLGREIRLIRHRYWPIWGMVSLCRGWVLKEERGRCIGGGEGSKEGGRSSWVWCATWNTRVKTSSLDGQIELCRNHRGQAGAQREGIGSLGEEGEGGRNNNNKKKRLRREDGVLERKRQIKRRIRGRGRKRETKWKERRSQGVTNPGLAGLITERRDCSPSVPNHRNKI